MLSCSFANYSEMPNLSFRSSTPVSPNSNASNDHEQSHGLYNLIYFFLLSNAITINYYYNYNTYYRQYITMNMKSTPLHMLLITIFVAAVSFVPGAFACAPQASECNALRGGTLVCGQGEVCECDLNGCQFTLGNSKPL